jgi:hypothetical protein
VRRRLAVCGIITGLAVSSAAAAQDAPAPAAPAATDTLAPDAHIDIAVQPPAPTVTEAPTDVGAEGLVEAPPPRPHGKGLVLESTLGVLGFGGQFRHVAPPAFWLHGQLGYDVTNWLMLFGEGELAFTATSESQDESAAMAFPLWGFGGGARATFHPTTRFAFFLQGQVDGLAADVPHDSLAILGYRNAETPGASFGARVGVEWYQIDRHMALIAQIGGRDALGFAKVGSTGDAPIMWDAAVGLSYTF